MSIGKCICSALLAGLTAAVALGPGPAAAQQAKPEQKAHGLSVWAQPMVQLRLPMLSNVRSDPFERSQHEAGDYVKWLSSMLSCSSRRSPSSLGSYEQFPHEIVLATGLLVMRSRATEEPRLHTAIRPIFPARSRVRIPSRAVLANTPRVPGGQYNLGSAGTYDHARHPGKSDPGSGPNIARIRRACVRLQPCWIGEAEAVSPQGMTRIGNNGRSSGFVTQLCR